MSAVLPHILGAMVEEAVPFERPDRKILTVWIYSSLITYGILSLIFVVPALIFLLIAKPNALLILLALAPVSLCGLTLFFLKRQWLQWGFRVTPQTVEIKKGLVWRSYRIVARNRIQHVDINSGPMDRRFGLVQVVIYTAGTVVGMIPGLSPERAEALRLELSASMDRRNEESE